MPLGFAYSATSNGFRDSVTARSSVHLDWAFTWSSSLRLLTSPMVCGMELVLATSGLIPLHLAELLLLHLQCSGASQVSGEGLAHGVAQDQHTAGLPQGRVKMPLDLPSVLSPIF